MFVQTQHRPLKASAASAAPAAPSVASGARPVGDPATLFVIRFLAVGALMAAAYLHIALALRHGLTFAPVSLAQMLVLQAVALSVAAALLLFRGSNRIWLVAVLVALAAAVPLLASAFVPIPAIGPITPIDGSFWYAEKVLSLVAELVVPALWLIRRIAPPPD